MGRNRMDDMVERAARALAGSSCCALADGPPGHIKEMAEANIDACRCQARIVIAAIRKPSNAMLKAAGAALSPGKRPTQKHVSVKARHGIRYRAMIDEALK